MHKKTLSLLRGFSLTMEDIKDLVSSLTVTGIAVLRNSKARRQLVKMVWIQLARNRRPLRIALLISFLSVVLSYVVGRYVIYRVFLHPANRYAGPPPFTGHLHQLFSKDVSPPFFPLLSRFNYFFFGF